jgi:ankyrin repeat protein
VAIKVDRAALQFRQPKSNVGATNAMLQKTLFSAIQGQKHAIVEQLLDRGVSPNGGTDVHPLWQAVHDRCIPILKLLLEFGADPNIPNGQWPPLNLAAEGRLEETTLLLQYGADPNPKEVEFPPLRNAIAGNHLDIVQVLLRYGADPEAEWQDGDYAIVFASWRNIKLDIVAELLAWGADGNKKHRNGATALEGASTEGYVETAKILLAHGTDPNLKGQEWPLDRALRRPEVLGVLLAAGADWKKCADILEFSVVRNCLASTKLLVENGMPVDTRHHEGYRPLTSALRDSRNDIVTFLLASGADPNAKGDGFPLENALHNPDGLRAVIAAGADWKLCPQVLEFSVVRNQLESTRILVEEAHMPVDTRHPGGYSPLTSALRDGRVKHVHYLLGKGADPNMIGDGYPLVNALRCPEGLKAILAAGADWKKCPEVLEVSVTYNELEATRILIEVAGMPPDTRHPGGYSPVTTACRDNRVEHLRYLLSKGADPNMEGDGFPIMNALRNPDTLELILQAGADPKKVTGIVEPAVVHNYFRSVQLLIERGASPNEPYNTHYYPVGSAIRDGRLKLLEYLLQHGGDPNSIGPYVPIVQAARRAEPDYVRLLLAAGANADKPDVDGNVALVEAAWHGITENVKLLLEHGANANVVNGRGVGAMDAAANQGHEGIVMMLLERM